MVLTEDDDSLAILLLRPTIRIEGVELNSENLIRVASFVMFYMKEHMFEPGKVESQVLIADL